MPSQPAQNQFDTFTYNLIDQVQQHTVQPGQACDLLRLA